MLQFTSSRQGLHRIGFLISAAACAAIAFAGPANAKPSLTPQPIKGPSGDKFYKPPKDLPKKHGTLIWERKATGITPIPGTKNTPRPLHVEDSAGQGHRRLRNRQRPQGQGAEGRLAGDLLRARHDRQRRRLRADSQSRRLARRRPTPPTSTPSSRPGPTPATRSFAPTTRASARPARTPTWSARPRAAASSTSSRRRASSTRRSASATCSPATRRAATRRCSRPGSRSPTRRSSSSPARSPTRPRRTSASRPTCCRR